MGYLLMMVFFRMSSQAQKTIQIQPYQKIGKPMCFGGLRIQLVAMPRRLRGGVLTTYRGKTSGIPRGERFYPFKLGFEIASCDRHVLFKDLYVFLEWSLYFEKNVRFLDGFGKLGAVKHNNYWLSDHIRPLKEILQRAEEIDLRKKLEAFM